MSGLQRPYAFAEPTASPHKTEAGASVLLVHYQNAFEDTFTRKSLEDKLSMYGHAALSNVSLLKRLTYVRRLGGSLPRGLHLWRAT